MSPIVQSTNAAVMRLWRTGKWSRHQIARLTKRPITDITATIARLDKQSVLLDRPEELTEATIDARIEALKARTAANLRKD